MVGGEPPDVAAVDPLLTSLTGRRVHVGGPGAGHAVKALNNLLSAAGISIAAEAIEIGSRFGVQAERMIEVFNSSSGRNWATEYKFPEFVLRDRFDSGFSARAPAQGRGPSGGPWYPRRSLSTGSRDRCQLVCRGGGPWA
jgi:3-hydroxyisobutyrate dehydrogenase